MRPTPLFLFLSLPFLAAALPTPLPAPRLFSSLSNTIDKVRNSLGNPSGGQGDVDKLSGYLAELHEALEELVAGGNRGNGGGWEDEDRDGSEGEEEEDDDEDCEEGFLGLGGLLGGDGEGGLSGVFDGLLGGDGEDGGLLEGLQRVLEELGFGGEEGEDLDLLGCVDSLQELAERVGVSVEELVEMLREAGVSEEALDEVVGGEDEEE